MAPSAPSDLELLRAIYRRLDRKALFSDFPGLTDEEIIRFFRRLRDLIGRAEQKSASEPVRKSSAHQTVARYSSEGSSMCLYIDGGSRGNPGPAGYGVVLTNEERGIVAEKCGFIGQGTNNEAEYAGLLAGLEAALEAGASDIVIRSDSRLLVCQLNGQYRVKSRKLLPLHLRARKLLGRFASWRAEHIQRELNKRADALANHAIDLACRSAAERGTQGKGNISC